MACWAIRVSVEVALNRAWCIACSLFVSAGSLVVGYLSLVFQS
jgi:hypothetical protein